MINSMKEQRGSVLVSHVFFILNLFFIFYFFFINCFPVIKDLY